jgi:hypothetical protein
MRQHRLPLLIVLAACLICPVSFLRAKPLPEPIVGTWELVGFGDVDGNFVGPDRLQIAIDSSGRFDYQVWEKWDGAATSLKVSGDWNLADDVLTMTPRDAEALKAAVMVYRIAWDGSTLLLHDLAPGNRDTPPARFAKRIAGAP